MRNQISAPVGLVLIILIAAVAGSSCGAGMGLFVDPTATKIVAYRILARAPGARRADVCRRSFHSCLDRYGSGTTIDMDNARLCNEKADECFAAVPGILFAEGPAGEILTESNARNTCARGMSGPYYCFAWHPGDSARVGYTYMP